MPALMLKWKEAPWVKNCRLTGPGGKQLSQPQGWFPAQTWPEQLEDGAPDEVLVLCCSTTRVQDSGSRKKMGSRSLTL